MKIAIVTDSTSDIPTDLAAQSQITVVPAILFIEGQSVVDGQGISRSEFYQRLPKMTAPPTTASPSIGSFQQVYENLLSTGVETILSIHVAGKLSGLLDIATLAARSFGDRIRTIDSRQTTLGLGFQALAAAEAIARGLPLDGIIQVIQQVAEKVRVLAMLDTLEYVRRSGRVSWAASVIGSLFSLKPLIELRNGTVFRRGFSRLRTQGIEFLRQQLSGLGKIERLAFLHTGMSNPSEVAALLDEYAPQVQTPPLVVHVTTVIGSHVGPNALGIAVVPQ